MQIAGIELRRLVKPLIVGIVVVILNIAAYLAIPNDLSCRLGSYGYLGVTLVTLIANATIVIPIPYLGVVAALAPGLNPLGIGIAGAIGSVIGESTSFFVGRSGRGAVENTRFYRWVQKQLEHPWRAFFVLFLLSAPPNPAFDVAGLTAGAMGMPFWLFALPVFLARIIRFTIIAIVGGQGAALICR